MATKNRGFRSLVGGALGDLDYFPVAGISNDDASFGIVSGVQHAYFYDATLVIAANNSPYQIIPADNATGTGAWVLSGTIGWIDRGDPLAVDYAVGDFTTDNTWRNLDLSSIVPTGAKYIKIRIQFTDDVAGSLFQFRKDGNSNATAAYGARTQVGGVANDGVFDVPCSSSQVLEYRGSNVSFNQINVTVLGWYI